MSGIGGAPVNVVLVVIATAAATVAATHRLDLVYVYLLRVQT